MISSHVAAGGACYVGLVQVAPGAFLLERFLDLAEQRDVAGRCHTLLESDVPAYIPVVRGGGRMHVRMLCLGRHWNAMTYRYEAARSDFDGRPAPPLPEEFRALAARVASSVGMTIDADICILNYYDSDGRMGLHQDKDESERSLAAGIPVVSISIGDSATFLFGGTRRRAPVSQFMLHSGDAFVFGGPARLCFHGVSRITPGSAPKDLDLRGRYNLTFRQFDVDSQPGTGTEP